MKTLMLLWVIAESIVNIIGVYVVVNWFISTLNQGSLTTVITDKLNYLLGLI